MLSQNLAQPPHMYTHQRVGLGIKLGGLTQCLTGDLSGSDTSSLVGCHGICQVTQHARQHR